MTPHTLDLSKLEDARLHPLWPDFIKHECAKYITFTDWMRYMHQHFALFIAGAAAQAHYVERMSKP